METTLKKNMSLYEEDQQPDGGRWRKILRYVLIAVILAIVIQMLYAGVLFLHPVISRLKKVLSV